MNLIASTSTFGFFTLISRILGYVRDILIAIFLGTGLFADAFFVAFRLPNTFRRLFAEGTFNAAFIPSYAGALAKNKLEANNFAKNVFNLLFIILLFFVLMAEIFMPKLIFLIAPGFYKDPEKLKLAIDLSRITFPFLFFICLASFFAAILNSYNKFAVAAAAPIILNVILIGSLFFSQWLNISDVLTLSYAVSFSGLLQLLILLFFVNKNFKPILLTIARLEKRKNHKKIIYAINELIKDFKNLLYLIAGDGPEMKKIRKLINKLNLKKNVKILGKVNESDKAFLFKISDLHVMPTIEDKRSISIEGFGISYIEAGMYGIPSISSGLGGTKESVIDGKTGIICNPNNVSSIKDSIRKVLINKTMYKKLSINSKNFSKKFLWKNTIRNYLKLITKDF